MLNPSKILRILVLALMGLFLVSPSAYAISNPDSIDFGTGTTMTYRVFENVLEDGDWLVAVEGYVYYASEPTDYTAEEAFLFELLNTAGNVTLRSTTLNDFGDRPISIYMDADTVSNLGLVSYTAYGLRLTGNPLIFPSSVNNSKTVYLAAGDYIDQSVATSINNPLRDYLIQMADNIEDYDSPSSAYITTVQGVRYLTLDGGDIFIEGIPNITTMCPTLFQAGLETMPSEPPPSTGAYALTLTPAQKWGATAAQGLTDLGVYLGINQALAGSTVLFVLVIMFAVFAYMKTESGVAVLLMVAATPFMGAYLGLMPMALAFIFVIVIITLLGYFFFSRGAL